MTTNLPDLNPIPADIEDHVKRLLRAPNDPALGDWLLELIQSSAHMSTGDDMRWRLLCTVWLALAYNPDAAWPYLQWLNGQEPQLSSHLSDMLGEALDTYGAHLPLAVWLSQNEDERLQTFFEDFQPVPVPRKLQPLFTRMMVHPDRADVGLWLRTFLDGAAGNDSDLLRPWQLLASAWYAAQFDSEVGLARLSQLANGAATLPAADNRRLLDAAEATNGAAALVQMLAASNSPALQELLRDFGHPDLAALANEALESEPDYRHLADLAKQAASDAALFEQVRGVLQQANLEPAQTTLLDLACGPLAQYALLFSSAGYRVVGVDVDLPPRQLPLAGALQWFRRRKHQKAWEEITGPYFEALAGESGLSLSWKKATLKLADRTRLAEADHSFEAVICLNFLPHAPDVEALLAEAQRVLKPGGLFVANIRPYASLAGALHIDLAAPWGHLREATQYDFATALPVNKWREAQFKTAIERQFQLSEWLTENDPHMAQLLTPDIQEELSAYAAEELTRKQIVVVAKKA